METLKVKLESGAELECWLASFQEGHALFNTLARVLKDTDLGETTVGKLSMDIISSEDVMRVMWPCLGKSVYTGNGYEKVKVVPGIFEKVEVRQDFLQIVEEVLTYNVNPFSRKIGLLLKTTFLRGISTPVLK